MPIKVKCSCGQVLSVSSKLAGKTGKCPKCGKPIKIPTPKKQAAPAKPAASPAAPNPAVAGAFDSILEDAGLTQKSGPTCPSCMADIKPGTVICTTCGFNLESGETMTGYDAKASGPEFDNMYLQEAADNMVRDKMMDHRRDQAQMPWWVIMSFFIGAVTLCAAGVIIVDGKLATPADENTFIGKLQRWPVFTTIGMTAIITGTAIISFAHMSVTGFGFKKSWGQGFACVFGPLIYSIAYGIMNWADCKAAIKAITIGSVFVGVGVFLVIQGGGFNDVINAFR